MADLRLVHNADQTTQPRDVDSERILDVRVLRSEATALTALIGSNPYSDFILKNGQRPDPTTAATIGKLMGIQVKACDGTMHPRRSKAEKTARNEARKLRQNRRKKLDQIARLHTALDQLASCDEDPAMLIEDISPLDEPRISKKLSKSIKWLQRFAKEWQGRGKQQEIGRAP